jgi:putative SOS response-associated peptidase YedK
VRIAGTGGREWVLLRWGLVPAWAPEPKTSYSTIKGFREQWNVKPG